MIGLLAEVCLLLCMTKYQNSPITMEQDIKVGIIGTGSMGRSLGRDGALVGHNTLATDVFELP